MALPLLALYHSKVRTMARKRPAVMERPFHLHIRVFFDPVEQHFYIDIVAMQIVQPNHIRPEMLDL